MGKALQPEKTHSLSIFSLGGRQERAIGPLSRAMRSVWCAPRGGAIRAPRARGARVDKAAHFHCSRYLKTGSTARQTWKTSRANKAQLTFVAAAPAAECGTRYGWFFGRSVIVTGGSWLARGGA